VNLTVGHVLLVALGTVVGASLGRFIRQRSRRLRFLNDRTRAVFFLLGITVAVVLGALSHASGVEKAGMVAFYIGAVYGLVASEPVRRTPAASDPPVPPDANPKSPAPKTPRKIP
jgi:NhaP-type Na+/H+ or K+/H+ antiporter